MNGKFYRTPVLCYNNRKSGKEINMARKPREKNSQAMYHIICRSISETLLFKDDKDKDYYLKLLRINSNKYRCSIYAYCLMDNHVHIHLDPKGYDISSFMHSINTSYVIYYNKRYSRHGHLFQSRFNSTIVDNERYCLALSAYIHNNPKDIKGYAGRVEEYKYSSYGVYLGLRKNDYGLVDMSFIRSLFGIRGKRSFIRRYREFVSMKDGSSLEQCCLSDGSNSANNEYYTSERKIITREMEPSRVIDYIATRLKAMKPSEGKSNNNRKIEHNNHTAFMAYVLRVMCGMKYRQICGFLFNITISNCSKICNKGYELLESGGAVYNKIFSNLILADLQ